MATVAQDKCILWDLRYSGMLSVLDNTFQIKDLHFRGNLLACAGTDVRLFLANLLHEHTITTDHENLITGVRMGPNSKSKSLFYSSQDGDIRFFTI